MMEAEIMSEYLAEKYAGILTEEDVNLLFNEIMKELGNNRSRAAKACRVTDKATYDWENAAYIKLGTKRKVLRASLENNFLNTVEFLLDKSKDRNLDLLETIFSTLYSDGLGAGTKDEFNSKLRRFEQLKSINSGLIQDGLQKEVLEMSMALKVKAKEFGVIPKPVAIKDYSGEELLNMISLIGDLYSEDPLQAETIAERDFGLPLNIFRPIIRTFKILTSTKLEKVSVAAERGSEIQPPDFSGPNPFGSHSYMSQSIQYKPGGLSCEGVTSA